MTFIFILMAVTSSQPIENYKLATLLASYGGEEGNWIGDPVDLQKVNGSVFLVNKSNCLWQINCENGDGKLIARSGQGPGEIDGKPATLYPLPSGIALIHSYGIKMDSWAEDGNHLDSKRLEKALSYFNPPLPALHCFFNENPKNMDNAINDPILFITDGIKVRQEHLLQKPESDGVAFFNCHIKVQDDFAFFFNQTGFLQKVRFICWNLKENEMSDRGILDLVQPHLLPKREDMVLRFIVGWSNDPGYGFVLTEFSKWNSGYRNVVTYNPTTRGSKKLHFEFDKAIEDPVYFTYLDHDRWLIVEDGTVQIWKVVKIRN